MKVAPVSIAVVILCSVVLIPQLALAEVKNPDEADSSIPSGAGIPIPDDGYDGTIASMACMTSAGPGGPIEAIDVDLGVDHSWVGDLTVKLVSPSDEVLTLMSRPGFDEPADDGSGCCGDSSDMINTSPVNFADGNAFDAEAMGATILGTEFVCQDDGECLFFPNPGAGPGTNLAQFIGQSSAGDWQVCVGDSVGADAGNLVSASVNITAGVPTINTIGLVLLVGLLAAGSLFVLRRKATIG